MKKSMAILLALIMLFSFAACSDTPAVTPTEKYDKDRYNNPGEYPIFKEKQTITVMLPDSVYVEDFNTNTQTLLLEERLNADLQIDALPSKEYKTKVSLMVASGGSELAQAVLGKFSDTEVYSYALSEAIVPVTEYCYNPSVAYHINKAIERVGINILPQITLPDGEIYGVPSYNDSVSNINPDKMYVYEPWANAVGVKLEDIKTTEDFKNLLIKFRDTDLNGNGLKDEIANVQSAENTSWFKYLMNAFVYAGDDNYFVVEDGELSLAYQKEEWKEGLKYIKDLYDQGLISPLTFTQDSASMKALQNYQPTIVGTFCTLGSGGVGDDRRYDYIAISPIEGPSGLRVGSYTPTAAETRFLISAHTKDVESVFRFGDLMVSEEISIHTRYGEKGVDYLVADENDVSDYASLGYKATIKPILVWSTLQNKHWYQTGPYIREKAISSGVVSEGDKTQSGARSQIAYESYNPDEYITKLIYTQDELDSTGDIFSTLQTYINEMTANFITGKKDIDAGWDDFQDELESIGTEKILIAAQAAFDRMQELY